MTRIPIIVREGYPQDINYVLINNKRLSIKAETELVAIDAKTGKRIKIEKEKEPVKVIGYGSVY